LLLALAVAACAPAERRVEARDYDAFWLWAGVTPQPVLDRATTVYILAGEVRARDPSRVVDLRAAVPRVRHAEVWLVYRIETLDWEPGVMPRIVRDVARWHAAGNRIAGVQVDFDAATRGLEGYAAFLREVRRGLPEGCKLSVTGLLDWSARGDPEALAALGGAVDEIVIQTYQGRATVPGYKDYIARLDRMRTPFKVGLVQGGEWREPEGLRANPMFRGYVVFLVNRR
jgi:Protein of unknown function (DUF3142)